MLRRVLLTCGLLSSLLYLGTDVIGGLLYPGYSFLSQAISELGAIDAPSKPFVDPLFLIYNVLALAFGVGVLREAAGRERRLQITGALLIGYGAVGVVTICMPAVFAMRQRGTANLATDAPHIALTSVFVVLLLLAIGIGAFALGRGFRLYSLATLVTIIGFIALTVPYAARLAAGKPTLGLGIVERIGVYLWLAWVAVLGTSVLRRPRPNYRPPTRPAMP